MSLNHYWVRQAFTTGAPPDDASIGGPNLLGGSSALRLSTDTLLRTRLHAKFRWNVTSSTPPPTLAWPKVDVAFWVEYAPNSVPVVNNYPDGITDMILSTLPSPVMYAHTQDRLNYTVLWETEEFANSEAQRKGRAAEGNLPGVNVGYQLFDPSGATFPPIRFSQSLQWLCFLETLWGSDSP